MKRMALSVICFAIAMNCHGTGILDELNSSGLPGKVSYRVVDPDGTPIEGVVLVETFRMDHGKDHVVSAKTGADGIASVQERSNLSVRTSFRKEGFYGNLAEYWFLGDSTNNMSGGVWNPWNPVIDHVMVPKTAPVFAPMRSIRKKGIPYGTECGVDFVGGALFERPGSTNRCDLVLDYRFERFEGVFDAHRHLKLSTPSGRGGLTVLKRNRNSSMAYPLCAPAEGYRNPVEFDSFRKDGVKSVDWFNGRGIDEELMVAELFDETICPAGPYYVTIEDLRLGNDERTRTWHVSISFRINPDYGSRTTEYVDSPP